jgi:hypothetical protein
VFIDAAQAKTKISRRVELQHHRGVHMWQAASIAAAPSLNTSSNEKGRRKPAL